MDGGQNGVNTPLSKREIKKLNEKKLEALAEKESHLSDDYPNLLTLALDFPPDHDSDFEWFEEEDYVDVDPAKEAVPYRLTQEKVKAIIEEVKKLREDKARRDESLSVKSGVKIDSKKESEEERRKHHKKHKHSKHDDEVSAKRIKKEKNRVPESARSSPEDQRVRAPVKRDDGDVRSVPNEFVGPVGVKSGIVTSYAPDYVREPGDEELLKQHEFKKFQLNLVDFAFFEKKFYEDGDKYKARNSRPGVYVRLSSGNQRDGVLVDSFKEVVSVPPGELIHDRPTSGPAAVMMTSKPKQKVDEPRRVNENKPPSRFDQLANERKRKEIALEKKRKPLAAEYDLSKKPKKTDGGETKAVDVSNLFRPQKIQQPSAG
jgi:hypothetical protein